MSQKPDPRKIQELINLTKENPNDPESWKALGTLYLDNGELLYAQKNFQKVLSINPDDIEAQVYLDRIIQRKNSSQKFLSRHTENFRSWIDHEIPLWLQLLISLISFVFIFLIALVNRWEVADMVWSLWITSLTLGYGYLLAGVTSNAISNGINRQDSLLTRVFPSSISSSLSIAVLFFGAIFQIIFFSIHFGLFHFVHSIFLNEFFPIIDRSFEKPTDFLSFIVISTRLYWPVILFTFFATLRRFQRIFLLAEKDFMKRPYINVIKIHISIFLFAGISAIGFQDWILLLIFVVYFFPLSATIEYLKNSRKKLAEV